MPEIAKPVSDLVVIGIIGIIGLPLDVLEFQRPAPLCNGLGQMVGIGAGQVGIAAGGCDRLGGTAIPGRLGLDAVQHQMEGAGKTVLRSGLLLLGQQFKDGFHVLLGTVHSFRLGDGLGLGADDHLPQNVGAFISGPVPLKRLHGKRSRVRVGREVIDLADFPGILVDDDVHRQQGLRIRQIHRRCPGGQHQRRQHQKRYYKVNSTLFCLFGIA